MRASTRQPLLRQRSVLPETISASNLTCPRPWDGSIDVEPLLHDSLCGGVYGSNDLTRLHSSTVTLNAVKASRTGGKNSVLSTVFPKREYLERRYPYLKKRPYLLPVAWVQRLAHYASEKQSGADNSASGSIKPGKRADRADEAVWNYGLIKRHCGALQRSAKNLSLQF